MTTEVPTLPVEPAPRYRWVVLAVGTLGVFAALGLARFGYSTVLSAMKADLVISDMAAGFIQSANLTGYLLLAVIGGALASRFGTRIVAALGLLVVGAAMILTGLASGFAAVCAWRAVTGLGSGAANIAIMGMWPAWFEPRMRGRAAGVAVAGSSLALMLTGPLVPRILGEAPADNWRTVWILFGAITLAVAVLTALLLRNRASGGRSAATSAERSWKHVYLSPRVWHLGAVYIAFGFSYIIYMTDFQHYLVQEQGYSDESAGQLFMLLGICSIFCGFIWGAVSDILGRRAALAMVFFLHAIAFALFAAQHSHPAYVASAIIFGLTAWSIPAIVAAACGDILGARMAAAGLGFVTLFFGIGQAFGPFVAGAVADHTGSYAGAFLLATGMALAGAAGSLLLPRMAVPVTGTETEGKASANIEV